MRANRRRGIGCDEQLLVRPVVRGGVGRVTVVVWAVVGAGGVTLLVMLHFSDRPSKLDNMSDAAQITQATRPHWEFRKWIALDRYIALRVATWPEHCRVAR